MTFHRDKGSSFYRWSPARDSITTTKALFPIHANHGMIIEANQFPPWTPPVEKGHTRVIWHQPYWLPSLPTEHSQPGQLLKEAPGAKDLPQPWVVEDLGDDIMGNNQTQSIWFVNSRIMFLRKGPGFAGDFPARNALDVGGRRSPTKPPWIQWLVPPMA